MILPEIIYETITVALTKGDKNEKTNCRIIDSVYSDGFSSNKQRVCWCRESPKPIARTLGLSVNCSSWSDTCQCTILDGKKTL